MISANKLLASVAMVALVGCQTVQSPEVEHLTSNYPSLGDTPVSDALRCLSSNVTNTYVGVHSIDDKTNRYTPEDEGAPLPISSTEMMVTALHKAGVPLVNRHQTAAIEWELKYAAKTVLGDGDGEARKPVKGGMRGSDLIVTGAFNNLDWNISSGGAELDVAGAGVGYRSYSMLVAADFEVWETVSTKLQWADTVAKILEGEEFKAGLFRFVSDDLVDFGAGYETHSPTQWSARYITELAAFNIAKHVYNADDSCSELLPGNRLKAGESVLPGRTKTLPEGTTLDSLATYE
jgi:curli biogenesis system outer membrane secretion channel CsgG